MSLSQTDKPAWENAEVEKAIVYVKDHAEYGRSYTIEDDDEKKTHIYLKPGKSLNKDLSKGCVYKLKLNRKIGVAPNGKPYSWYITEAELVAGEEQQVVRPIGKPVSVNTPKGVISETTRTEDIRWLACLKVAGCISKTVEDVLKNANVLYYSKPEAKVTTGKDIPEEAEGLI